MSSATTELPTILVNKVPFPGQFLQLETLVSTSNLARVAALRPKVVFLLPSASEEEVSTWGVIARMVQVLIRKNGAVKLTVRCVVRGKRLGKVQEVDSTLSSPVQSAVPDDEQPSLPESEQAAFRKLLVSFFEKSLPGLNTDLVMSSPPGALCDAIASGWSSYSDQLRILAAANLSERIKLTVALINQSTAKSKSSSSSSSALVPSLGSSSKKDESDLDKLRRKLEKAQIPTEQREEVFKDFAKLQRMQKSSTEYEYILSYLEFAASLPWSVSTEDKLSIAAAKKQLDDDHCGLEKIKRRIVEYLAVLKLRKDMKAPLLCFIGPPGTGKSSLGESIAKALGRKFERVALGGVRDEAVIRGHRRTYVGALPGRILEAIRRCKANNPVILLDEIDKLASDHRGDPAAALLEVLDPVQNNAFVDNYLGVPFDLSKVLFVATGNSSNIQAALKDRMELIEVPGYSMDEKTEILKKHLLPKQLKQHGMEPGSVVFDESAIASLIRDYTLESGVRNLTREVGAIVRYLVAKVVGDSDSDAETEASKFESMSKAVTTVDKVLVAEILGPAKYEEDSRARLSRVGVSTGLAYNGTGGGAVLYIEATQMEGKGKVQITGSVADVMQESVHTAISWIRSNAKLCQISGPILDGHDLHVHFPAGATKKDGPSAGVAVTVALVSLLSNRRVNWDCAMTGEISLTGVVLPIGGVKEKSLAAHRHGIKRVFLPLSNLKDLHDVPASVKKDMTFIGVQCIEEVLEKIFGDATLAAKL